jgi:hypothetical protein
VDVKYHILKKRIEIPTEPVIRVVITCTTRSVVRKNLDPVITETEFCYSGEYSADNARMARDSLGELLVSAQGAVV